MLDKQGHKHILRICNTYRLSTAKRGMLTSLKITLYVYCMSCSNSIQTDVKWRAELNFDQDNYHAVPIIKDYTIIFKYTTGKRLRWSTGSLLPFGTKVRGFKPGLNRRIFSGRKNPQHALLRKGNKAVCPMSHICCMQEIPECYVEVGHFQTKFIGYF